VSTLSPRLRKVSRSYERSVHVDSPRKVARWTARKLTHAPILPKQKVLFLFVLPCLLEKNDLASLSIKEIKKQLLELLKLVDL
jgi:hypothetical protein